MKTLLIVALTLFSLNQALSLYRADTRVKEVIKEVQVEVPVFRQVPVEVVKEVVKEVPVVRYVERPIPVQEVRAIPQNQAPNAEPQWFYYRGERFRAYPRR